MKKVLLTAVVFVFFLRVGYGQTSMRALNELIDTQDPGWDLILQWKSSATNKVEILPKIARRADSALYQTQLTTNSPIAAIVYGSGGILIDDGWIRILGSGCKQLDRSLPQWNKGKSFINYGEDASFLLIADDVLGGFFAINAGGIDMYDIGKVFYFGPNKLKWESTGLGFNEFIVFCFSGDLEKFYKGFRWNGWESEVKRLNGNQVVSCYPMLWTDAGTNLASNRKVVGVQKQWDMYSIKGIVSRKKAVKKSVAKRNK